MISWFSEAFRKLSNIDCYIIIGFSGVEKILAYEFVFSCGYTDGLCAHLEIWKMLKHGFFRGRVIRFTYCCDIRELRKI